LAIEKIKSHKSPGIDQIPAELIKADGRTIHYEIHKLTITVWNKEKLPEEWKGSIIVPIYKKGDKTDCSNYRGVSVFPTTYKTLSIILLSRVTPYTEDITGLMNVDFYATSQLLIMYSSFIKYLRSNGNIMRLCIRYL